MKSAAAAAAAAVLMLALLCGEARCMLVCVNADLLALLGGRRTICCLEHRGHSNVT